MDWITGNIAIGNFLDAQSLPDGIDAVLCLREDCPDVDALTFIEEVVSAGQRVLVHCRASRSRSCVIVARHLMQRRGLTAQAALDLISARREIYLSPGIEELLTRG